MDFTCGLRKLENHLGMRKQPLPRTQKFFRHDTMTQLNKSLPVIPLLDLFRNRAAGTAATQN